ncbi:ribonuclease D [Skermania piniformis]|uniref:Ribonuclease D n=1 Tax=Skermania pinensis TaxID=39122 RepID=A0ABX8SFK7_9ACTN|nr:ribonuclease D [Skermania piniformis]QXQ15210.1 ribonuclease D [Skermania piniformis]
MSEFGATAGSADAPEPTPVPLLAAPVAGVPPVVDTADGVRKAADQLAAGTGPLAVDAERASGFRYSPRAYLIQLRRRDAGTVLIDPIPVAAELDPLIAVVNDLDWTLHAADQDLPGLADLGLTPMRLYDTELAGRLAGFERVGLAAMVERLLGFGLAKGHGAADWSKRPLPDAWLNYAALDVELLPELRDAIAAELSAQGKTDWAAEEFEYIRTATRSTPRTDRWRRTSQIHTLRRPRQLAVVRELWTTRDNLARNRDIAPGRILPDAAIVAAASVVPSTVDELRRLSVFGGPRQRRLSRTWLDAIERARALPTEELPPASQPFDGPPPPNRWARRNPEAADRLTAARAAMTGLSEQVRIPTENLLVPDLLRRLCWDGVRSGDLARAEAVDEYLRAGGARAWQRELVVPRLVAAFGSS